MSENEENGPWEEDFERDLGIDPGAFELDEEIEELVEKVRPVIYILLCGKPKEFEPVSYSLAGRMVYRVKIKIAKETCIHVEIKALPKPHVRYLETGKTVKDFIFRPK